jgi:hypothetical protein
VYRAIKQDLKNKRKLDRQIEEAEGAQREESDTEELKKDDPNVQAAGDVNMMFLKTYKNEPKNDESYKKAL